MSPSHNRLLLSAMLAGTSAAVLGTAVAPALSVRATSQKITPTGVGAVKIAKTHAQLRAAKLVSRIGPGCELGGPNTRSARLSAPLSGLVNYTMTSPRKANQITVRGGATAKGVGIGASTAEIKRAFPKAITDHGTDQTFGITLVKIPKNGGGRLEFAVDTKTKKVTLIGIPRLAFCD